MWHLEELEHSAILFGVSCINMGINLHYKPMHTWITNQVPEGASVTLVCKIIILAFSMLLQWLRCIGRYRRCNCPDKKVTLATKPTWNRYSNSDRKVYSPIPLTNGLKSHLPKAVDRYCPYRLELCRRSYEPRHVKKDLVTDAANKASAWYF